MSDDPMGQCTKGWLYVSRTKEKACAKSEPPRRLYWVFTCNWVSLFWRFVPNSLDHHFTTHFILIPCYSLFRLVTDC